MGIRKYVCVILVFVVILSVGLFVSYFGNGRSGTRFTDGEIDRTVGGVKGSDSGVEVNGVHCYIVKSEEEYNRSVRKWMTRARLGGVVDPGGINSCLPASYTESTPLIEIHCKERGLDGKIKPLKVRSLYLFFDEAGGPGGYHIGGTGLRLELGRERTDPGILEFDREYNICGQVPGVEAVAATNFVRTRTLKFRTPASLKEGEIYVVDLVLVDRLGSEPSSR